MNLIEEILNKYSVEYRDILDAQSGYRNTSYPIKLRNDTFANLIIYKNEASILQKIEASNSVSNYLNTKGLPTRKLLDSRILTIKSNKSIKYCALYNYLPGKTIPWEAYTMTHIKLIGKNLAHMHELLKAFEHNDQLLNISDSNNNIIKRMTNYFENDGVNHAMSSKLQVKINSVQLISNFSYIKIANIIEPSQALHLDFVRGNLLFKGENNNLELSGILDFEKTLLGNRIFDLARTLAFLIIDCKYKTEVKVRKYLISSGYNKNTKNKFKIPILKNSNTSTNLLNEIVCFYLIFDFYKFLLHNPYEDLFKNEHYLRTRDYLLTRNILIKVVV